MVEPAILWRCGLGLPTQLRIQSGIAKVTTFASWRNLSTGSELPILAWAVIVTFLWNLF